MNECKAGAACRDSKIVSGQRKGADVADSLMCAGCMHALRKAIRKLNEDYGALCEVYGERGGASDLVVNMTPDPVIPINATVLALQDELAQWAEAALELVQPTVSRALPKRQKGRGYPVRNMAVLQAAEQVLGRGQEKLLIDAPVGVAKVWRDGGMCCDSVLMTGPQVAVKIILTHAKVKSFVGDSNPRRRLAMPCPRFDCGMPTLGIDNGETDITCTSCGGRWSEAEYDWFAGMAMGTTDLKEIEMLRQKIETLETQLRQANTQLVEANGKLEKIAALANLPELGQFDTATVAAMLREILEA